MVDFPKYGEQPGLFDEVEAKGPVTLEVLRALVKPYYNAQVDPRTGLPFPDGVRDRFQEEFLWEGEDGDEIDIEGFGKFVVLHTWGEHRDGASMGKILKDLNTTIEYLFATEYSSWDSEEWVVNVGESYTFTETRWRIKK